MCTEGCRCRFDAETDEIVTMCAAHMTMQVAAAQDEREACAAIAADTAKALWGHDTAGARVAYQIAEEIRNRAFA